MFGIGHYITYIYPMNDFEINRDCQKQSKGNLSNDMKFIGFSLNIEIKCTQNGALLY